MSLPLNTGKVAIGILPRQRIIYGADELRLQIALTAKKRERRAKVVDALFWAASVAMIVALYNSPAIYAYIFGLID